MLGVTPDGRIGNRIAVASRDDKDKSLSGEFRLIREWQAGPISHRLTASVRGRAKDRLFGGSKRLALTPLIGPGTVFDSPDNWPEPAYTLDPKNRDRVRQIAAGFAYSLFWQGKASLDIGVTRQHYTKTIDFADAALPDPLVRDRPWLWNVSASLALTRKLILFGGMSRGQEDAIIAPDIASNKAEVSAGDPHPSGRGRAALCSHAAPRAGGQRLLDHQALFQPRSGFALSPAGQAGQPGLEFSLTGQLAPGLSLVGGMLLLDPRISGEAVDSGLIGMRPVGQVRRRIAANLDWRSRGGKGPFSFDLAVESLSSRMANAANTLSAPPRSALNLGARYRFAWGKAKLVLRPQVNNVFNNFGWNVSPSGGFTFTGRRFFGIGLLADI